MSVWQPDVDAATPGSAMCRFEFESDPINYYYVARK
jgi:hypothetical protein